MVTCPNLLHDNETVWINGKQKAVHQIRDITKGKHKGKLEVSYLHHFDANMIPVYRTAVVPNRYVPVERKRTN